MISQGNIFPGYPTFSSRKCWISRENIASLPSYAIFSLQFFFDQNFFSTKNFFFRPKIFFDQFFFQFSTLEANYSVIWWAVATIYISMESSCHWLSFGTSSSILALPGTSQEHLEASLPLNFRICGNVPFFNFGGQLLSGMMSFDHHLYINGKLLPLAFIWY